MILLISSSGTNYSFNKMLSKNKFYLLISLHNFFGYSSENKIILGRIYGILAYGFLCISSALFHSTDEAWLSGLGSSWILTSSYIVSYHDLWIDLYNKNKDLFVISTSMGLYITFLWEIFFLFAIFFNKYTRLFAIFWGFIFILISHFVLQLGGLLPEYELLLWVYLFSPLFLKPIKKYKIYFDDKCNLCNKTMRFFLKIDFLNQLDFCPISKNINYLKKLKLLNNNNLDIFLFDEKKNYFRGYEIYLFLSKKLILLVPLFPFFFLGKYLLVGKAIYNQIGKNRIKIFGVCEYSNIGQLSETKKNKFQSNLKVYSSNNYPNYLYQFTTLYIFFFIVFIISSPRFSQLPFLKQINNIHHFHFLKHASEIVGYGQVNVFNLDDITLDEQWQTITVILKNGEKKILPFHDHDGSRLELLESDSFYYGNSLGFRREFHFLDREICYDEALDKSRLDFLFVKSNMVADENQIKEFIVDYYYSPLLPFIHFKQKKEFSREPQLMCKVFFDKDYRFKRKEVYNKKFKTSKNPNE